MSWRRLARLLARRWPRRHVNERVQQIVAFYRSAPPEPPVRVSGLDVRARWARTAAILNEAAPAWPVATHRVGECDGYPVSVAVYAAGGAGPHPGVLFIHGGAWVAGSPATHHRLCIRFAERGYTVFSVDYPLAPEHRFPAGLDGCALAAAWVRAHAVEMGVDAERLVIAGDSAGANLAAALLDRIIGQEGRAPFRAAVLPYGVYDFPAMLRIPTGAPFVNGATFAWQVEDYVGPGATPERLRDPGISPRYGAHLGGYPPTLLTVGTSDPLLEQSREFAAALQAAGVAAELRTYEAMPHAFLQIEDLPGCRDALAAIWRFLAEAVLGRAG